MTFVKTRLPTTSAFRAYCDGLDQFHPFSPFRERSVRGIHSGLPNQVLLQQVFFSCHRLKCNKSSGTTTRRNDARLRGTYRKHSHIFSAITDFKVRLSIWIRGRHNRRRCRAGAVPSRERGGRLGGRTPSVPHLGSQRDGVDAMRSSSAN